MYHALRIGHRDRSVGTQDARYDELTVDQVADIGHRAAVERLVGEFDRHLVGELVLPAQRRQPLVLLFELHAQGVADEDHREYDAHDAERISHGVTQRDRGVFDSQRIGVSLLRGTQSGGVGHCARKDADHRRNRRARRQMNYIGRRHAQQYDRYGTHDQRHAAVFERCEKSRSDLQTDREDEQNQPEFLHEVPDLAVHRHSEMTQDDTYEQNPCDSERDAADFDFSEQNADGDDQCEGQHGMGDAAAEEQGV